MSAHVDAQVTNAKQLTEKLRESGKSLVPILEGNLVDKVWGADRPAPPTAPLRIHKMEHAGQSVQDKLVKLRKDMQGRLAFWVSFSSVGMRIITMTCCALVLVPTFVPLEMCTLFALHPPVTASIALDTLAVC